MRKSIKTTGKHAGGRRLIKKNMILYNKGEIESQLMNMFLLFFSLNQLYYNVLMLQLTHTRLTCVLSFIMSDST